MHDKTGVVRTEFDDPGLSGDDDVVECVRAHHYLPKDFAGLACHVAHEVHNLHCSLAPVVPVTKPVTGFCCS